MCPNSKNGRRFWATVRKASFELNLSYQRLTDDDKMDPPSREDVRNLILGYPAIHEKFFLNIFAKFFRVNPEILGYPRIPRIPRIPL